MRTDKTTTISRASASDRKNIDEIKQEIVDIVIMKEQSKQTTEIEQLHKILLIDNAS